MDADIYASLYTSGILYQYLESWLYTDSSEEYEKFIGFMTGSLFVYLLSFPSMERPIYFKENSHPHVLIRIMNVTATMLDYIDILFENKNVSLNINRKNILPITFQVVEQLCPIILHNNRFMDFGTQYFTNENRILEYLKELRKSVDNYEKSALRAWNQRARK